jgi:hypothetical protein
MKICQPKLTIDVAPSFVLPANGSLVGILHNNGLRHSVPYCDAVLMIMDKTGLLHAASLTPSISTISPKENIVIPTVTFRVSSGTKKYIDINNYNIAQL